MITVLLTMSFTDKLVGQLWVLFSLQHTQHYKWDILRPSFITHASQMRKEIPRIYLTKSESLLR